MAIIRCNEIWSGREAWVDEYGYRHYRRKWRIVTDDPTIGPLDATATNLIPGLGVPYVGSNGPNGEAGEFDYGATVREVRPQQTADDPRVWECTVTYSSQPFRATRATERPRSAPGDSSETNPLLRPPEIRWDFAQFQKPAAIDAQGAPITNSAGQRFDPPAQMDDCRLMLTIARNEVLYNYLLAQEYINTINSGIFYAAPVGTWKMQNIIGNLVYENTYLYWKITYSMAYRAEGWGLQLLDQGSVQVGAPGNPPQPLAPGGVPIGVMPLNGAGFLLPAGAPFVYVRRQIYQYTNWDPLYLQYY